MEQLTDAQKRYYDAMDASGGVQSIHTIAMAQYPELMANEKKQHVAIERAEAVLFKMIDKGFVERRDEGYSVVAQDCSEPTEETVGTNAENAASIESELRDCVFSIITTERMCLPAGALGVMMRLIRIKKGAKYSDLFSKIYGESIPVMRSRAIVLAKHEAAQDRIRAANEQASA